MDEKEARKKLGWKYEKIVADLKELKFRVKDPDKRWMELASKYKDEPFGPVAFIFFAMK